MNIRKIIAGASTALLLAGGLVLATTLPASATGNHCVPKDAWTEVITPEVPATPETPAVEAVYKTVIIKEAGWQRYSFKGAWPSNTEAPPFPSKSWQANTASDPHGIGVAGAYYQSKGNSGHGDWFYLEATPAQTEQVLVTPAVPAVPGTPAIPAVTVEHEAVVCEEEPPVVVVPDKPKTVTVEGEWITGAYDCDDTTVTETRKITNVGHVLIDNVWVLNPQPSDRSKTETRERDLTDAEIDALDCPVVLVPPVEEPPAVTPPAEVPATPAKAVPVAAVKTLPVTGGTVSPVLPLTAAGLLLSGAGLAFARRRLMV